VRILELTDASHRASGAAPTARALCGEVGAIAQIALPGTKVGGFSQREQVLEAAAAHMPVLESYDAELYEELVGSAVGCRGSPEEPRRREQI